MAVYEVYLSSRYTMAKAKVTSRSSAAEPAGRCAQERGEHLARRARNGQRVGALLEAVDALLDVQRVVVHGGGHDVSEVVRQVVGRVEARVLGAVSRTLLVLLARRAQNLRQRAARRATPPSASTISGTTWLFLRRRASW